MIYLRIGLRGMVCLAVLLLHRLVGGWLGGMDVLDELISGSRWLVGSALLLFVGLRGLAWFVVPPWLLAGLLCDLWDYTHQPQRTPAANQP